MVVTSAWRPASASDHLLFTTLLLTVADEAGSLVGHGARHTVIHDLSSAAIVGAKAERLGDRAAAAASAGATLDHAARLAVARLDAPDAVGAGARHTCFVITRNGACTRMSR